MKMILFIFLTLLNCSIVLGHDINDVISNVSDQLGKKGFYASGTYESGILKGVESYYTTFTMFHGNTYAIAIATSQNKKPYQVILYDNNMKEVFRDKLAPESSKIWEVKVENTGHYYLNFISAEPEEKASVWMYLYGFKKSEK